MTSRTHAQQAAEESAARIHLYYAQEKRVAEIIERHIAAALAEQEAEQWIDVREDLPKLPAPCGSHWKMQEATYLCSQGNGYRTIETFGANGFPKYVTSWRALPAPPANTKKAGN